MNGIHLDVTSACQSGLNTGVKRMQRGLHAFLMSQPKYRPVYWQSAWRDYRDVTHDDLRNLERPLDKAPRGIELYDNFAPGLLRDWLGAWRDPNTRLKWPQDLHDGDLLLVPDLLWDNRGDFFRRPCSPRVRRVGIFHDAIALRQPGQSRIDAHFCRRGIRALAHFDDVICVSAEAEADLRFFWKKFSEKPVPTHVLHWPVPFTQPRPRGESNFEAREILCVARLEPHKNHLCLLGACEQLWNEGIEFKLRLIGCKAYPDAAWKILRRVEFLQSKGRDALWTAYVSEDDLHTAYRSSSFTAFPSLLEGFGLPIIESLWHGRPVICGKKGALGEVASAGGCETVDLEGTESLAGAIRLLLNDKAHYDHLCQQARDREFKSWLQYWNELLAAIGPH